MTSDAQVQVGRVLRDSGQPADATEESPLEPDLPPDRTRQFRYTSFSRMKMSWVGDDATALGDIHYAADQAIKNQFGRALRLIERLQEIVSVPLVNEGTGEVLRGPGGRIQVKRDEHGDPVEDWGRLSEADRTNALFSITTHLHEWESTAVRLWTEAMFSKVLWEEAFAQGFIKLPGTAISGRPTVDDRTQTGHAFSAQERYFAVFCSALSRHADALVRNIVRVQRLLDNVSKA